MPDWVNHHPTWPNPKKELAESGALDPFEELLRDDLIGINVGPVHWGNQTRMFFKWRHLVLSYVYEVAGDGGGGGHAGGDQMGSAPLALAAFEVAVGGRCTALAGR